MGSSVRTSDCSCVCPHWRSRCVDSDSAYGAHNSRIDIGDARARLASTLDDARLEPVYLTRRNRPVVAVVDAAQFQQLLEDAEELADMRAVDAAWEEAEALGEESVPWDASKRDLGLAL